MLVSLFSVHLLILTVGLHVLLVVLHLDVLVLLQQTHLPKAAGQLLPLVLVQLSGVSTQTCLSLTATIPFFFLACFSTEFSRN